MSPFRPDDPGRLLHPARRPHPRDDPHLHALRLLRRRSIRRRDLRSRRGRSRPHVSVGHQPRQPDVSRRQHRHSALPGKSTHPRRDPRPPYAKRRLPCIDQLKSTRPPSSTSPHSPRLNRIRGQTRRRSRSGEERRHPLHARRKAPSHPGTFRSHGRRLAHMAHDRGSTRQHSAKRTSSSSACHAW